MISKIVPGYGRGSRDLGIPTANISRDDLECPVSFDSLPCGIYWGFARIIDSENKIRKNTLRQEGENQDDLKTASQSPLFLNLLQQVHKAAISIGYNPCYSNTCKTIEPHLIAPRIGCRNDTAEDEMRGGRWGKEKDDEMINPFRYASSCQETLYPDMYGYTIRLSVVGFLRPELPFESLEKLIIAIKEDIRKTESLCDGRDEYILQESEWVQSSLDTSYT